MKPLYVPDGADPGHRIGHALRHLQTIMLDAGYDVAAQEAFAIQVWLNRRRQIEGWLYLIAPPITEDEIDAMIAEGVVVLERADADAGGNGDTDADTHAWDGK